MTPPSSYQPLAGSQRPRPASATLVGPLAATANISATLLLRQRTGSPALPDLAYWQQIPAAQRTFLSADDITQVYGAAQTDMDTVATFVNSQGMSIVESHLGRRSVIVQGTAAQWSTAFGVSLNQYSAPLPQNTHGVVTQTPGTAVSAVSSAAPGTVQPAPAPVPAMQTYRGFDGQVYLPPALSGVVISVIGLDNRIAGCRAGTGDPPFSNGLLASSIAGLYNFPTTGANCQTIGVFAPSPAAYLPGDITTKYFPSLPKGFNTPPNLVNINLTVDGTTYSNSPATVTALTPPFTSTLANDCAELTQDISTSSTIAQGANVNVYFTENTEQGWLAFIARAVIPDAGENQPSVLTASWLMSLQDDSGTIGSPTDTGSVAYVLTFLFQLAAAAGITVFIALGDWGADDSVVDGHCHTSFPSSDPWAVSCGGTIIGSVTLGPPIIFKEFVWSDAFSTVSPFGQKNSDFGATGGGVSDNFPLPGYQAALKPPPTSKNDGGVRRGVPDVAGMTALTGFFLNASPYSFVGTSCVAPLYAGLTAVLSQTLGQRIGLLHPSLYAHPKVCNDITFGNNDSGDAPDSPFYTAATGWDSCTGLGSVDGTKLLAALGAEDVAVGAIDTDNPFNFSYPPAQNGWAIGQGYGASDSFDSLNVGQFNTADNFGLQYGPYDAINQGDGDGPDVFGDVTVINTAVGYNATFAADNIYTGEGSIGLYGRSRGTDFSMGALGQSSQGAGLYGLATGGNPSPSPCTPAIGIGVVGRSMGGVKPERISVERIVGQPVGVLGHATTGPGVRGHSGPLFTPPSLATALHPVTNASPGGVFSSGRLQNETIAGAGATQQMSVDSLPQMRLVPTTAAKLPTNAKIGDFFVAFSPQPVGNDPSGTAQLFVCTHFLGNVPQWQQVQMGAALAGGSSV